MFSRRDNILPKLLTFVNIKPPWAFQRSRRKIATAESRHMTRIRVYLGNKTSHGICVVIEVMSTCSGFTFVKNPDVVLLAFGGPSLR